MTCTQKGAISARIDSEIPVGRTCFHNRTQTPGKPAIPAMEVILTMRPRRLCLNVGMNAFATATAPKHIDIKLPSKVVYRGFSITPRAIASIVDQDVYSAIFAFDTINDARDGLEIGDVTGYRNSAGDRPSERIERVVRSNCCRGPCCPLSTRVL